MLKDSHLKEIPHSFGDKSAVTEAFDTKRNTQFFCRMDLYLSCCRFQLSNGKNWRMDCLFACCKFVPLSRNLTFFNEMKVYTFYQNRAQKCFLFNMGNTTEKSSNSLQQH
jgi:hypothetical protein